MAGYNPLEALGLSFLSGIFNATGAATQAGIQGVVNTGVSQTIGTFNEAIHLGLGMALSQGTNALLQNIGINVQNIPYVGGILYNIAQSGVNSAATVFQHVIDGNLTLGNLPFFGNYNVNSILSNDPGIIGSIAGNMNGLTNTLTSFLNGDITNIGSTNYVSNAVKDALGSTLGFESLGIDFDTPSSTNPVAGSSILSNKTYASVMADRYPPKFKFLYIVTIQFVNEYRGINNSFTFLVKQFERPKVTIEHDEINFYSFRSMVPKKTVYQPFNIEIHDDIQSEAMKFIVGYLRKVSPLFNQPGINANSYELNGMDYTNASSSYGLQTQQDNYNVIDNITVYHLYNYNATMDVYTFHKPKILEVTLGEWDMSAGTDGSSITLNMAYDALEMQTAVKAKIPGQKLKLLDLMANRHPKSLSTADSNGAPINGHSITDLTYIGEAPPSKPGSPKIPTKADSGKISSPLVPTVIQSTIPKLADLEPIVPKNATAALKAAQDATGTGPGSNIISNLSFIQKNPPRTNPASFVLAPEIANLPSAADDIRKAFPISNFAQVQPFRPF